MDPPRHPSSLPSLQLPATADRPRNSHDSSFEIPSNSNTDPSQQNERVNLDWDDGTSTFKLEAECTETKTVTTTTTVKRTYPLLALRPERYLGDLDAKRYPLANHKTPENLVHFSYLTKDQSAPSLLPPSARNTTQNNKSDRLRSYATSNAQSPYPPNIRRPSRKEHDATPKPPRSPDSIRTSSFSRSAHDLLHHPSTKSVHTPPRKAVDSNTSFHSTRRMPLSAAEPLRLSDLNEKASSARYLPSKSDETSRCEHVLSPATEPADLSFSCAVATPPITDTDHGPFDGEQVVAALSNLEHRRPTLTSSGLQSASLPSPSLSPTLAAAKLHDASFDFTKRLAVDSLQSTQESDEDVPATTLAAHELNTSPDTSVVAIQNMMGTFAVMPEEMKAFMLFQMLKTCEKKTLRTVSDAIYPALKCDFLDALPIELSLHVLSYLDHKDLCRATQVSRQWCNIIDSNEAGWKELFDKSRFTLGDGELLRAIREGWGWQDPIGLEGYEMDLSRPILSFEEADRGVKDLLAQVNETPPTRSSHKRKRTGTHAAREHVKRHKESSGISTLAHKWLGREGPTSAALAATTVVPNPDLGLPNLQRMHLYKSLFRRHYLIRHSWLNAKMQPHHMAFPAHGEHVITCLQFDDDKIITGSDDTFIHVYDTKTGKLRRRLQGHEGGVWALQYVDNVLVSGSTDRSVRVWDIEKGVCTQVFHGHTSTVRCLQIVEPTLTGRTVCGRAEMLPEQPLIITGSRDSQLRVWNLPTSGSKRYIPTGTNQADTDCPYFVRTLMGHGHSVRAIAAHSDMLVSGSYDFTVRVWKISTGETEHVLRGHVQKVYSVVLDTPRKRCISGSMDFTVKIWSTETGACLFTLEGHTSLVGLLDLQDNRLVSAAADATLRIWDPETGLCKSTLSAHTGAITCFQHDGEKVISGSDRTLKMWDVKTGECVQDLLTDLTGVWQVRFDARRCVAAVQREGSNTYLEVLDFGASRDGKTVSERGRRELLPGALIDRVIDVDELND